MVGSKIIKVCGMREAENIADIEALGIDMMGFIFYSKSPRCVSSLPSYMPRNIEKVGVFVNQDILEIKRCVEEYGLTTVQLHGSETPFFCQEVLSLGVKVIKAFSVETKEDLKTTSLYEGLCSFYIFDTKCSGYGGSGLSFDWSILDEYKGATSFLLSGGIAANSAVALQKFFHPMLVGYDLNSRFEDEPALKNIELLKQFLKNLENHE